MKEIKESKDTKDNKDNNKDKDSNYNNNNIDIKNLHNEDAIINEEIKKIKELYDKRKKILIPVSTKNEFDQKLTIINHNGVEFKRPSHYIVYGERKKNEVIIKPYEISQKERDYISKEFTNKSLSEQQYELIIEKLEDTLITMNSLFDQTTGIQVIKEVVLLNENQCKNIYDVSNDFIIVLDE